MRGSFKLNFQLYSIGQHKNVHQDRMGQGSLKMQKEKSIKFTVELKAGYEINSKHLGDSMLFN